MLFLDGNPPSLAPCTFRNGSGVNSLAFGCVTLPVLGASWVTAIGSDVETVLTIVAFGGPDPGSPFPSGPGELLINPAPSPTLDLGIHSIP